MVEQCFGCRSTNIDVDPTRGVSVCCDCGTVLSEHAIVSDVQYVENSRGQSSAQGQFISHDSSAPRPMFKGCQGTFSKESREITYYKGKRKITALANQLNLNQHCQEIAYNYFKLCVVKGLTRGRGSLHVIGACTYMVCRTEQTSHMLIDVSDAIEVDVYELGRTYLRLSTALCLNIPAIDPCLYIIRFSHKLKFGDKTHDVSETASRLVQRMKKDWMHFGRRPSGVCGAALVIAARFHNFNRTIQDVIKVVKVHESTLRKRLTEFGSTPTSSLTPDEFLNTDLDQEEDPPAFKAARRKEQEKLQTLLDQEQDLSNQFTDLQLEIERILSERKTKLRGIWASAASSTCSSSSSPSISASVEGASRGDREVSDTVQFIAESTMQSIHECMGTDGATGQQQKDVVQEILPTTASMGLKQTIEESMEIRPSEPAPAETGILDLDGIDDDEIQTYILSDRERQLKTKYWLNLNKDYLDEMEKKKEQERLEEEQREREGKPPKKKKAQRKKGKNEQQANTAGEAMERIIKTKKLSNKIDYSVLKNLNGESDVPASDARSTVSSSRATSSRSGSRSSKRATHPPIPDSFREIMQSLTGQRTPQEAVQQVQGAEGTLGPRLKKQKCELDESEVQQRGKEQVEEEEEEEDEEEEEEDDLRNLLGPRDEEEYY